MKKILCLFGALALVLTSCSSDDENSGNLILPKTISYTYPDFPEDNSLSTITYDGNKIVSMVKLGSKTIFTYDGNLIIKQQQFDVDQEGKENKDTEVIYAYENGKLKTRILKEEFTAAYPDGEYIYKTVYIHNTENKVSFINYDIDAVTEAETKRGEGILEYKDGNVIKQQQISNSITETRTYEYDTKNNPLKNILGFGLMLDEVDFGINNKVKTIRSNSEFPNSATYKSSYIYNDKDYPIKQTSLTGGGSVEYEIEYTY